MLAEIGNFTPEEMEEYENSLKNMSDYYNIIDSAEKRARDEGRLEGELRGLEKGREEAKREDAIKLRELGVDFRIIAQATGLSVKDIEAL
ncbi:MAG: hypothetical protein J6A91_07045 [Bacteroidales bacterium]|nr:hypothetical protein [Bacteroidales bacterium]